MIDEIKLRAGDMVTEPQNGKPQRCISSLKTRQGLTRDFILDSERSFPASLLDVDSDTFSKHLAKRKEKILSALSGLFAKLPSASAEVTDLQQQLSTLLAREKQHIQKLQKVTAEKEHISGRLDTATHRYLLAERKIDRLKSAQVQKLERQAIAGGGAVKEEPSSAPNGAEVANGVVNGPINEELEQARDAAVADAAKRKEQLEKLEAENKKLTEDITALNTKLAGLSDDDYAKTDLFKMLKSQHEDVLKRINHLEATNIQLREEAKKFQAERTEYRIKVDGEASATVSESESHVARAEADLARIRHNRDELLAKVSTLDASLRSNQTSRTEAKELVSACENRIQALESECERLRLQLGEQNPAATAEDLETLSPEELKSKILVLRNQHTLLNNELPAMESAWKKAQALAGKKVAEIATWEESVGRANADKAKADQKYFAAMKTKETLEHQNRVLRAQTTKSAEVVAQLKEAEAVTRSLADKLEKQCAEMKTQMEELSVQHRALQQKFNEATLTSESQVTQIAELKKVLEAKDTSYTAAKHAQRESEAERDKLAAQVRGLEKQCEHWKKKSMGNQSDDAAMMQVRLP